MTVSASFAHRLVQARQLMPRPANASAFADGPQQLALVRGLARHAPPKWAPLFEEAAALWRDASLVLDGSKKYERGEIASLLTSFLPRAVQAKKRAADPYLHDALHVVCRMLRLARFLLLHPDRPVGEFGLSFPRTGGTLSLLIAAERFFDRTETEGERALLRELFSNPRGIAEVSKRGAVYAFQAPAAVHLLTPYGASTHPKTEKTVADLRKEVSAHS